jgi:hypothetical protein
MISDLDAVIAGLGDLSDDDRLRVAHMVARERGQEASAAALRQQRRSYPVTPGAPERNLYSCRVPADSVGALLASPSGWLRGDRGPLRIEAVLPEIVVDEYGGPQRQLSVLASVGERWFLLTHEMHRDDTGLELPATADQARARDAAAALARELTAGTEAVLATRCQDDRQWLTPLLDALVAAPAADSVFMWLLEHHRELATVDAGPLRMALSDLTIERSFAHFGRVQATQRIDRVEEGAIVDTCELAFMSSVDARLLLAPVRHGADVPVVAARYRQRLEQEEPPEELIFAGLEPAYVPMLAEVAAAGVRPVPAAEPPVSETSIAHGARLLEDADPGELDHDELGVGEALHAFAFGDYRIYLCASAELETPHGAIVLAHQGEPPPIIVMSEESIDAGFPVDGSAAHFAAFHAWLVRSLQRRGGGDDAVDWLEAPAAHQSLVDQVHPRDRGEARPWLFIASVPWVELDEAMLAQHEHEVRVYHGFLRAAIDPAFAAGWDPRAEVLAARTAADE